jgi:hypothetical protein
LLEEYDVPADTLRTDLIALFEQLMHHGLVRPRP